MRAGPILAVLLWTSSAAARAEVSAVVDAAGSTVLRGPDCTTLNAQVVALSDWSRRLGETPPPPRACLCGAEGCSVPADAAPSAVRLLNGRRPLRWGPNCWNAALVAAGVLPETRYSPPEEMAFWTRSPLCRELSDAEQARPGDVVAIRERDGSEVHGYIHITDALAFSKNRLESRSPYELQDPGRIFAVFPVPASCRGSTSGGCDGRRTFYRCRTMAEFLASTAPSPEFRRADEEVRAIEARLSALAFGWDGDAGRRRAEFEELATLGSGLAEKRMAALRSAVAEDVSDDQRFLWRSLVVRLDAVKAAIAWF